MDQLNLKKHFEIVKAFNSDPTIDALMLTTHVGGIGLNLTSTDTLIFMEHDWNPMGDHQGEKLLKTSEEDTKIPGRVKGLKAILGGLEELWDQSQYTEEYNLNQFLAKLNG
ncbi:tata-binding protein-associated factor btaf1 [Phtheirospermum japonicum]|uniref:Tata-binding protein-associated factor btaf1 n=1 Tax=Phtheirospermum japonicum TaxID=374723 RepID=A0A830BWY8_9LAMI|nr:tata-binding protein-associated factor btaf1 [Phtheirospermum japonicum]